MNTDAPLESGGELAHEALSLLATSTPLTPTQENQGEKNQCLGSLAQRRGLGSC